MRPDLPEVSRIALVALVMGAVPGAASAQVAAASLDAVTVSATRPATGGLGLPVTLDAIGPEDIDREGVGVELPRPPGRVPGIGRRDGDNQASDLQLSTPGCSPGPGLVP